MRILTDLHTHTLASDHAYSTVFENLQAAAQKNLEAVGMTDHATGLADAPHEWHFLNMKVLPREVNGVFLFRGVECSVTSPEGEIDYPEKYDSHIDYAIASMHARVSPDGSREEITEVWKNAAKNSRFDIVGHCADRRYSFFFEPVIRAFAEYGKIVEVNEVMLCASRENADNYLNILKFCKQYSVPVVVDSDAHVCFRVGEVSESVRLLRDADFPESLVLNTDLKKIIDYFKVLGREFT